VVATRWRAGGRALGSHRGQRPFEAGPEILARLLESSNRDEQELLLQIALLVPIVTNEGYASAGIPEIPGHHFSPRP
jgi:hypothetical protein